MAKRKTKQTPALTDSLSETIAKVPTGIAGLDLILDGGLPQSRVSLLVGTAGCGKTIAGCEFLWHGINEHDQHGVFVTFEESKARISNNVKSFGWDLNKLEQDGQLAFVEFTASSLAADTIAGDFDLSLIVERIKHAVAKVGAKRVFIDSISAFFDQLGGHPPVRRLLLDLAERLNSLGVTTLLSGERYEEYGSMAAYKAETFVSDCVIVLRHVLAQEKNRRTVQVLKYRGSSHKQGEFPFTIASQGIVVIQTVGMELTAQSTMERISSGNQDLDRMCGGGLFRDSIVLISGPTGTGKTTSTSAFAHAARASNERAIIFGYEESRDQLFRNAASCGIDLVGMEAEGLLRVVCAYPESAGPEEHLLRMRAEINQFQPHRVVVDSLSSIERVSPAQAFREFVIALTSHLKQLQIAGLFTNTTTSLMGGESITETHISTLTDAILLLRYVEVGGRMLRGLTVIKMRGSRHDNEIVSYKITDAGMQIGKPFYGIESIMTGSSRTVVQAERDQLMNMLEPNDKK